MSYQRFAGCHKRSTPSGFAMAVLILWVAFPTFWITGCGSPGAPVPPSLRLPAPVEDLAAARIGNGVQLTWTMPARTTDRVVLKHPVPAEICRALDSAPCSAIATIMAAPGKPASYIDSLSTDLTQGSPRLLAYRIELRNHAQKSAGPSNAVYTAAGAAPATLTGLAAQSRRDGVLLSWHPATEPESQIVFRIERVLESQAAPAGARTPATKSPLAPPPPPAKQTLAVSQHGGNDPGNALDTDAQLDQRYQYRVERVAALTVAGHAVEVQGEPSEAVEISTADVFPPAVPTGLVAVADVAARAVDLSWSPPPDRDLAGYYVYRRDLGLSLSAERISATVIPSPAFHDAGAQPGHGYAYSISAIDGHGNESARTAEVTATLPGP